MFPPSKSSYSLTTDGDTHSNASATSQLRSEDRNSVSSEDIQEDLNRKIKRQSQLLWNLWFVAFTIVTAWLCGFFGFSIAWALLLIIAVYIVWWGSLNRLIEESLSYEKRQLHRSRALSNDETAEWFNFILNRWWVFSSQSIFTWLKANLESVLNEALPAYLESVKVKKCSLGNNTPFVSTVRAFDTNFGSRRSPFKQNSLRNSSATCDVIRSLKYRLVIQADVGILCPEFEMILIASLKPRVDVELFFKNLQVIGKIQLIVQFSMDVPFPHISKATVTFLEKPFVNFDTKTLMTSNQAVSDWFNSLIMDALTASMVDPFKLELNLSPVDVFSPALSTGTLAQGVLSVLVEWMHKNEKYANVKTDDSMRWCVLRLGSQKYYTNRSCMSSNWKEQHSFLVETLHADKLVIKVKTKKLIGTTTLAEFALPLKECFEEEDKQYDKLLQKKGVNLVLKMKYYMLKSIQSMDCEEPSVDYVDSGYSTDVPDVVAGVMFVCIHGADGLPTTDHSKLPNPYCIVYCNTKKIKTTPYVNQTSNPRWECSIEFLVMDFTQTTVSIAVCSWDVKNMTEAGLLGSASVNLSLGENKLLKHSITLDSNTEGVTDDQQYGTITVSVIFRPVPSVAHNSGNFTYEDNCTSPVAEEDNANVPWSKSKCINTQLMNTAKIFLPNGPDSRSLSVIPDSLNSDHGLLEVTIIRAKNLLAKDLNGFSDPFCEIQINHENYFKSSVKKRTLNPLWEEKTIVRLPRNGDIFTLLVWDHDTFGRDFLGSIILSGDDIMKLASKDGSEWFTLKETKSGEIELKFKVISEGLQCPDASSQTVTKSSGPSTAVTPVLETGDARPNFYGDGSLDVVDTSACKPEIDVCCGTQPVPDLPPKIKHQVQSSPTLSLSRVSQTSKETSSSSPQSSIRFSVSPSLGTSSITSPTASSSPSSLEIAVSQSNTASLPINKPSKTKSKLPASLKPVPVPAPPERKSSLPVEENSKPDGNSNHNSPLSSPVTSPITRGSTAYSSLHEMKRKVKKTFSHPLRRFRSEANVHEEKGKAFNDRVVIETRDDVYSSCSHIEKLPDDNDSVTSPSQTKEHSASGDSGPQAVKKLYYYNVKGSVVQATGIDVPKASQISCRVRLIPSCKTARNSKAVPKTLAKTKFVQASPNPAFNLDFEVDASNGVPGAYLLCFEIRTLQKEAVAAKSVSLQELFAGVIEEGDEMRTCLSLSSGATLEVILSHSKQGNPKGNSQRKVSKLLRSWSVHRIGKI